MIDLGFSRLVRYEYDGQVLFGDLKKYDNGKYLVKRLDGDLDCGFRSNGDEHTVHKVSNACQMSNSFRSDTRPSCSVLCQARQS